jgi:hypothetical protein
MTVDPSTHRSLAIEASLLATRVLEKQHLRQILLKFSTCHSMASMKSFGKSGGEKLRSWRKIH